MPPLLSSLPVGVSHWVLTDKMEGTYHKPLLGIRLHERPQKQSCCSEYEYVNHKLVFEGVALC